MNFTYRLLPFVTADGPWQMAADECLLEAAVAGTLSFRLYSWSLPTLSLGYFQPQSDRQTDPLLADLMTVRRSTGGAALVHDREVTYALALPADLVRGESWIRRIHEDLREVLRTFGIATNLCVVEKKEGSVLCFLHQTPNDLLLDGSKIAGSAQRKMRGALLQHGGILLAQSRHTPSLPGIAELTGANLSSSALCTAFQELLAARTGWRWETHEWSRTEFQRIDEIVRDKYATPSWTAKR